MLAVNGPATSAIPTSRTEGGIAQAPPAAFSPATVAQLQQIIRSHRAILVKGAGSKPALSTPGDDLTTVIDMSSMSGILDYEPDEYTITALAGTPVAEITQLLAQHGQYLPFDPPLARAGATLAGTAAAGISGSNRYRYGGARDFILGIRFVDGQGNLLQGGGRVVKNAAGFDLPKLMVGSLGRLGILTELTFKVFPKPEAFATLSVEFKAVDTARRAMIDLSRASLDLEALDLQPTDHGARLWIRISGLAQLLDARLDRLQALVGDGQILTGAGDERYWQSVSEFQWAPWDSALIKIPLTTGQIPAVEALLRPQNAPRRYAVGGNVLWLTLPDLPSSLAESLSHLEMAGLVLRGAPGQPCIGTPPGADFARRVKQVLDPDQRFLEL
ncbi:MAG: FAD-binding protein [Chloroflexota bacterium]|nr:FAD-binding protein [Chloroflexota bacterium]